MELKIFQEAKELDEFVSQKIVELLTRKPDALLCLPSGNSPVGIFKELIKLYENGKIDFSKSWFVGLDEWVAIGKDHPRSCRSFMQKTFFSHVNLPASQICFFDGEAEDMDAECRRIDRFIQEHGAVDFMLLGVGMNGHLGLNEPGVDPALLSHTINVDPITREVAGKKYFDQPVKLERGVTLGIQQIRNSKEIYAIMNGSHKAEIARRILKGSIGAEVPATWIREMDHAFFCLDKEAAALL